MIQKGRLTLLSLQLQPPRYMNRISRESQPSHFRVILMSE